MPLKNINAYNLNNLIIYSMAEQIIPFMSNLAFITIMVILGLWEAVWKGIGLWKSGRNNQLPWFVAIFIFNTAGILPIIYLFFFQKHGKKQKK